MAIDDFNYVFVDQIMLFNVAVENLTKYREY